MFFHLIVVIITREAELEALKPFLIIALLRLLRILPSQGDNKVRNDERLREIKRKEEDKKRADDD